MLPHSEFRANATDQELIARIAQRDLTALEDFYDRHRSLAYGLALRLVGAEDQAEQMVVDSFLLVLRYASQYDASIFTPREWLLGIVHVCCRSERANLLLTTRTGIETAPIPDGQIGGGRKPAGDMSSTVRDST